MAWAKLESPEILSEEKVARLDDASVHRADGHMENTFALDRAKLVSLALEGREFSAKIEVFAQRIHLRPVVVQCTAARIGMAD